MIRARLGRSRKLIPAVLALAGCSPPSVMDAGFDAGRDAGNDAGTDAGSMDGGCAPNGNCVEYTNACGMRCGCLSGFLSDGGFGMFGYCDDDIGNPCTLGCSNPREADGGRQYNGGVPVCLC